MIEPVPQRHRMGCGVACVGFVIRRGRESVSAAYDRALLRLGDVRARTGCSLHAIVEALNAEGYAAERHVFARHSTRERLRSLPALSIVQARRYEGDRWLHYVVFTGREFVDPLDRVSSKKKWGHQTRGQVHQCWPKDWTPLSYVAVT